MPAWPERLATRSHELFVGYGPALLLAAAFCMPIRLSLLYLPLIPLLSLWVLSQLSRKFRTSFSLSDPILPLLLLYALLIVAAPLGIDPARSLSKLFSPLCFATMLFAAPELLKRDPALTPLVVRNLALGHLVASLVTIIESRGFPLPFSLIGAVSEAGQLALTLPLLLVVVAFDKGSRSLPLVALGTLATIAATVSTTPLLVVSCALVAAGTFLFAGRSDWRLVIIGLLAAALFLNEKRGPWLGVLVSLVLLFGRHSPRLALGAFVAFLTPILAFEPFRNRILDSVSHFFISGGRYHLWEIATELFTRYPLGIGYANSPFLLEFSRDIPAVHNHFHSNLMNLGAEAGFLGMALYLWFIIRVVRTGWSQQHPYGFAVALAVISSTIAGTVEYNFGDSEVRHILFLAIAILRATASPSLGGQSTGDPHAPSAASR